MAYLFVLFRALLHYQLHKDSQWFKRKLHITFAKTIKSIHSVQIWHPISDFLTTHQIKAIQHSLFSLLSEILLGRTQINSSEASYSNKLGHTHRSIIITFLSNVERTFSTFSLLECIQLKKNSLTHHRRPRLA